MRRRILLLVIGITVLVVLAFSVPLAVLIRHNVYADAVTALTKETNDLALYLRGEDTRPTRTQITAYLAKIGNDTSTSVQLADGTVLGRLPPGGLTGLPQVGDGPGAGGTNGNSGGNGNNGNNGNNGGGFGGHDNDGGRGGPLQGTPVAYAGGRLAQLPVPVPSQQGGIYVVRVWASDPQLHSGETRWWLLLGLGSLGLLVVGVTAGELLTRRIVRPLVHTAETAQRLAGGDVTARATTDGPPEVAEVGQGLNRLADRIDELIAEERETVADLSHRLRTPLTALRLDAEALRDPADSERIGAHVVTLERMLTAVIHAARRPQREGRLPSCDARAVVGERVEFWSALAEDQERATTVELPGAALPVRAGAEDLAAAVDALLENVFAHTPEGTAFSVRLTRSDTGGCLEIADEGPGLPDDASVRGRSDRGSSGLGLDIARRCAESSGGSMTLGPGPAGGALIRLDLRAP